MESGKVLDPRAMGARRFVGKVAVVGGGGQGIGSATVRRLAQEGASVVVVDAEQALADRVLAELREFGAPATTYVGDPARRETAEAAMAHAVATFGRIDALANCVMGTVAGGQPYQQYRPDQVEAELGHALWPPMWMCWAALPYMIEQRSGAIVNLTSYTVVSTLRIPYTAAKAAAMGLTTSLAMEVVSSGIRVNCVAPHMTDAPDVVRPSTRGGTLDNPREAEDRANRLRQIPMGRRAMADEQAAVFAFLLSDDASFITGHVIPVGGGAVFPF